MIKTIFTNGCFDILHRAHVELLRHCSILGYVIVGLNSDIATHQLKGKNRPINKEKDRKKIIESLKAVDEVIIFDAIDTKNLIKDLQPHIIVKGGEWTAEEIRKRDKIPENIEIYVYPFKEGYSSSNIISIIKGEK